MTKPRQASITSGVITASGNAPLIVTTTAGALCSVNPFVASTGDLYVIAYDSTTAAGTVLYRRRLDVSIEGQSKFDNFSSPIRFVNGLTFTITGTAPDGVVVGYVDQVTPS